ncbi:MAG: hypothetical protein VXX86_03330 [Planctomycetota bacterium]|nr:hypothetical protein [Planctomycetota bacterium]
MKSMTRFLTVLVVFAAANLPAIASRDAGASVVPEEYAALVGADTKFAVYLKEPAKMIGLVNGMIPEGSKVPTTIEEFFEGVVTSDTKTPVDQPILVWGSQMPSLFMHGNVHIATRVPKDVVGKITVAKDDSVDFVGDIMVLTIAADKNGWSKPAKAGSPVLDAMPDAGLAISIEGKQVGTQLGDMDMMPSGMFMEWVNARLGSFSQGAKRYADPALTAALQGVGKDVSTLVNQLSSPLKSTEMLGLAIDLDSTTLSVKASVHLGKELEFGGTFNPYLTSQLPEGMPMYLALGSDALRWITQLEFDMIEGFTLTKTEQVKKFAALGKTWQQMVAQQRGAAAAMTLDTKYQWINFDVKDTDEYVKLSDQVMSQVGTLDIGVDVSKRSARSWKMVVDGKEVASLIGGGPMEQERAAKKYGGTFGVSYVVVGDLVMAKQFPLDKPDFPKPDRGLQLASHLTGHGGGHLIASMAMDMGSMIEHMAGRGGGTPPAAPELAMSLVLSSPSSDRLELAFSMPSTATAKYAKAVHAQREAQIAKEMDAKEKASKPAKAPTEGSTPSGGAGY